MYDQTELLPKTELDEAHAVLNKLIADQEKAAKAVDSAEEKLDDITTLVGKQRHVIALLSRESGAATVRSAPRPRPATQPRCWVWKSRYLAAYPPEEDVEGEVIIDPITGELLDRGEETGTSAPEPYRDPTTRELVAPHVFVAFPDDPEGKYRRIEVGERTTYGELVARFLTENLIDLEVEDFDIVSEGGTARPLNRAIVSASYGCRYYVQPKASEADLAEHEALKAQEPAA